MSNWKEHPATNRQIKVLRFFGIPLTLETTKGYAARHITNIFSVPELRERWNKYVFITGDTEWDSSELKPFDLAELRNATLPQDWEKKILADLRRAFEARAESIRAYSSPFDDPELPVTFQSKHFCFTGKFEFGSRKECWSAIEKLGGIPDDEVNSSSDYLVVGKLGSKHFAKQGYGRKIEWAIVAKFEFGKPILISEDHWRSSMESVARADSPCVPRSEPEL